MKNPLRYQQTGCNEWDCPCYGDMKETKDGEWVKYDAISLELETHHKILEALDIIYKTCLSCGAIGPEMEMAKKALKLLEKKNTIQERA